MKRSGSSYRYFGAIALVALASLVCEAVRGHVAPTNMVMVYLLAVVLAASRLGLRPAIATSFLSVLAFDIFFVLPRFSLRVSDTEYLFTFFALFVVGVVISTLVAKIQEKVEQLRKQEARTSSLYYLTRDLTGAGDVPAIITALQQAVRRNFEIQLAVVVNQDGSLERFAGDIGISLDQLDDEVLLWVLRSGRTAGVGTAAFSDLPFVLFPIKSGGEVTAVMVMAGDVEVFEQTRELIESFAGQAGMAMERVHLASQAEEARLLREKNVLEQALLNSISHDLRTPLVTISGVLESLRIDEVKLDPGQRQSMINAAAEEAARLNRFVGRLLDMTRLEAGMLIPRLVPCDVEEIIGSAAGSVEQRIGDHRLVTLAEPDLPTVMADAALLNLALVNLLDNAVKFSPPHADVTMTANRSDGWLTFAVMDSGPGIPVGEEERIFEKFYRLAVPERSGGTGLGLSIAKGIVESHGGVIMAFNRSEGGLRVEVRLPAADTSNMGGTEYEQ